MMDARKTLTFYLEEAQRLLATREEYVTTGNKLALKDMMKQATLALEGRAKVPHTRKREFFEPREEEEILFALEHFTMAPTYIKEGVFDTYGLKPAVEWFKTRDIMYGLTNEDTLEHRREEVEKKCQTLLKAAVYGEEPGKYSLAAANILKKKIEDMKEKKGEILGKAIVDCYNALRDLRFSRVYESDIQKGSNLFLSEKELKHIRKSIKSGGITKSQYEQIAEIAQAASLEQRIAAYELKHTKEDYEFLNRNYTFWEEKNSAGKDKQSILWSSTGTMATFTAPENTVNAGIAFVLSSSDNEEEGLGHVWIDNIEILSAQGANIPIKNAGFEEELRNTSNEHNDKQPAYWKPEIIKGNPILYLEDKQPFCGNQTKSLYMCNMTAGDEGEWEYEEKVPLTGGATYTLTFDCKVDGKLKEGLRVIISFEDEQGRCLGNYEYLFNRKAYIPCANYNLSMQCNAIVYAISEDITYAKKVKYEILCMLDDFCQGVEHWLVRNSRPEGSDAYGAVQGGRNLCSIAFSYACVKNTDVFSEKEKEELYAYIDYMLRYMLDYRDRTELTLKEAQKNCGNWQTDMCIGASMIMAVLEDYPDRKIWLNNAYAVLRGQLECNINQDGSWPESIRYHHAALERFTGYAKMLLTEVKENWFTQTRLSEMFAYGIKTQTPKYEYFNNRIGTPPFGDHCLTGGNDFSIYGVYIHTLEKINKELSDKMYETWLRAGRPVKKLWGESLLIENLHYVGEEYRTEDGFKMKLTSEKELKDAGIYIFRKTSNVEKESYFAIMSSPKPIAHGHLDQGSFILYKDSVPLVMDSGIEGYFDASTTWHICSYSHACVQFGSKQKHITRAKDGFINLSAGTFSLERGWVDVPKTSKVIECSLSEQVDKIVIEILNPEGEGIHKRTVLYFRKCDIYVIKDTVDNYEGKLLMNIPVVSKESKIYGNTVYSTGYYNVNLQTTILTDFESLVLDKGRTAPVYPTNEKISMLEYIRAVADSKDGFVTVLYPRNNKSSDLTFSKKINGWEVYYNSNKIIDILQ